MSGRTPGASAGFAQLRALVEADPAVESHLQACPDWRTFTREALDVAAAHGIVLSEPDIALAREEAQRSWLSRWV